MQRLSGSGIAFVEFDGYVKEYTLAPGQQMVVDTGYLAAMDSSCSLDVRAVPGVKNMFFGGEGIFNTVVTGPGNIWIHLPDGQCSASLLPAIQPLTKSFPILPRDWDAAKFYPRIRQREPAHADSLFSFPLCVFLRRNGL